MLSKPRFSYLDIIAISILGSFISAIVRFVLR
jgi:hypothetical protein